MKKSWFAVFGATLFMSRGESGGEEGAAGAVGRVDHLVYATPDLKLGIDAVEKLLGIQATPGGQHPGAGTRNALVALGPASNSRSSAQTPSSHIRLARGASASTA